MKFSERYGYRDEGDRPQVERIDKDTRTRVWNLFMEEIIFYHANDDNIQYLYGFRRKSRELWDKYYYNQYEDFPSDPRNMMAKLKETVYGAEWYDLLDFIEITSTFVPGGFGSEPMAKGYNDIFREENVAYRIIDGRVTPIAETKEKEEIEEALERTSQYTGVREHIKTANKYFSDRGDPDYRNSIKESISAVESMAQIIVGDSSASLGQALRLLEEEKDLHPALKGGFSKLYGYTSDADGIRHGLQEKSTVTFADAKFMLVSCTAFVNYLIDEYEAE